MAVFVTNAMVRLQDCYARSDSRLRCFAAGVARRQGGFGPIFDHMALSVTLAERWLVDVGFGDSFLEPLLLDSREEQVQGTRSFRIDADNNQLILLRRNDDEDWEPQYRFPPQQFGFPDYEEMCRFHQTSPESHFTQNIICSRVTEDGRITLTDMRLITTSGPQRTRHEQMLTTIEEYDHVLTRPVRYRDEESSAISITPIDNF